MNSNITSCFFIFLIRTIMLAWTLRVKKKQGPLNIKYSSWCGGDLYHEGKRKVVNYLVIPIAFSLSFPGHFPCMAFPCMAFPGVPFSLSFPGNFPSYSQGSFLRISRTFSLSFSLTFPGHFPCHSQDISLRISRAFSFSFPGHFLSHSQGVRLCIPRTFLLICIHTAFL